MSLPGGPGCGAALVAAKMQAGWGLWLRGSATVAWMLSACRALGCCSTASGGNVRRDAAITGAQVCLPACCCWLIAPVCCTATQALGYIPTNLHNFRPCPLLLQGWRVHRPPVRVHQGDCGRLVNIVRGPMAAAADAGPGGCHAAGSTGAFPIAGAQGTLGILHAWGRGSCCC